MEKMKQKFGFTLAEALIALLVVSLITIATVPIVTKKKKDVISGYHGRWTCYMLNGTHQITSTINGQTTTTSSGSSCTFVPPGKAKNFSVKVIGAGGGGAAGSTPSPKTYTSDVNFKPEKNGDYIIAVMGGGGGGGQIRCGTLAKTGATGGWDIQQVTLRTDKTCNISIGKYGEGNCGHDSKSWDKITGGTTTFSCNGYTVRATGGEVGDSRDTDASDCDWKEWSNGNGGQPNGQNYISTGSLYKKNYITDERIKKYISTYSYGYGGDVGNEDGNACGNGARGAAAVMQINTSAGGAGTPGAAVVKAYPKLPVTRITLGNGGIAGTSNNSPGARGGNTVFGNLIVALGGHGGEPEFNIGTSNQAKGESATVPQYTTSNSIVRSYGGFSANNGSINASPSQFDGINGAGAGGAGGGGSLEGFGQGAHGRPGLVIIEW